MIIYKGCRYRNSCPYPGAVRHPGGVSSKHRKRKIISPMKAPCLPPLTKSKGICLLYFVWVPGYGTQNFAHARLTNKLYLSPPSFLFWAKLSLCCSGRSWSHGPPAPASLIAGIAGALPPLTRTEFFNLYTKLWNISLVLFSRRTCFVDDDWPRCWPPVKL